MALQTSLGRDPVLRNDMHHSLDFGVNFNLQVPVERLMRDVSYGICILERQYQVVNFRDHYQTSTRLHLFHL